MDVIQPIQPPVISPVMMPDKRNFFQKHKITLISVFIILLAAVPLLLLSNTASKQKIPQQVTITPSAHISPTNAPLTNGNADQTLNQANTNIDSSMNQMNTDLNAASSVDASQDSTSGL